MAWFAVGSGQELHVGVDTAFAAARKAHPALAVPSKVALADLAAALERAGHAVTWDVDLPGTARFYVDDPFGNRLELLTREESDAADERVASQPPNASRGPPAGRSAHKVGVRKSPQRAAFCGGSR